MSRFIHSLFMFCCVFLLKMPKTNNMLAPYVHFFQGLNSFLILMGFVQHWATSCRFAHTQWEPSSFIYWCIRLIYHFSPMIIFFFFWGCSFNNMFWKPLNSTLIVCVCSFLLCAAGLSATCRPPEQTAPSASGSGIHALSSSGEKHSTHTLSMISTAQTPQRHLHLHIPGTFVYFSLVGV